MQLGVGGFDRGRGPLVFLSADGVGLEQLGITFDIGLGLRLGGHGRGERRFGLLELGFQVRVVESHEHVALVHFLAGVHVDFEHAGQQLGADRRFVDGPHRADGGFSERQLEEPDFDHLTRGTCFGHRARLVVGHFGHEPASEPDQQQHDTGQEQQTRGELTDPASRLPGNAFGVTHLALSCLKAMPYGHLPRMHAHTLRTIVPLRPELPRSAAPDYLAITCDMVFSPRSMTFQANPA